MDTKYWNSLSKNYTNNVLEINSHDINKVLIKEVKNYSKKSFTAADLGCGPGSLIPLLSPHFKHIYAVDFADELLKLAKEHHPFKNTTYHQHDLTSTKKLPFKADITFCINALISPNTKTRTSLAKTVWRTTKVKGRSIFVVPSFESILHTYHTMLRCQIQEGNKRHNSIKSLNTLFKNEVISVIDGIVKIGGTPTKCYTKDELEVLLTHTGFKIEEIKKIEYPWEEEIENKPRWLKAPYPYDWLIRTRRLK